MRFITVAILLWLVIFSIIKDAQVKYLTSDAYFEKALQDTLILDHSESKWQWDMFDSFPGAPTTIDSNDSIDLYEDAHPMFTCISLPKYHKPKCLPRKQDTVVVNFKDSILKCMTPEQAWKIDSAVIIKNTYYERGTNKIQTIRANNHRQ